MRRGFRLPVKHAQVASNAVGTGPASAPSSPAMPTTVPGAPTGVTATAGYAHATVSFSPPASNGGSPTTSYTVTANAVPACARSD